MSILIKEGMTYDAPTPLKCSDMRFVADDINARQKAYYDALNPHKQERKKTEPTTGDFSEYSNFDYAVAAPTMSKLGKFKNVCEAQRAHYAALNPHKKEYGERI